MKFCSLFYLFDKTKPQRAQVDGLLRDREESVERQRRLAAKVGNIQRNIFIIFYKINHLEIYHLTISYDVYVSFFQTARLKRTLR